METKTYLQGKVDIEILNDLGCVVESDSIYGDDQEIQTDLKDFIIQRVQSGYIVPGDTIKISPVKY